MSACASCGKPVEALVVSCSRECALAHWREVRDKHGITFIEATRDGRGDKP